jgi:hypothetical protein
MEGTWKEAVVALFYVLNLLQNVNTENLLR